MNPAGSKITRRPWTDTEDARLRAQWAKDIPLYKIGQLLNRKSGSLHARAKLLELPPRPPGTTKIFQMVAANSRRAKEEDDYFNMRRAGVSASQTRETMGLNKGRAEQLASWYVAQVKSAPEVRSVPDGPTPDDRHVAAVLAEGGFQVMGRLPNGDPAWIDHEGRPWRHVRSILP